MKEGGRSLHFFRKLATHPCSLGDSMADVGVGSWGLGLGEVGGAWRVALACGCGVCGPPVILGQNAPIFWTMRRSLLYADQ
eukprot:scaffold200044_cov43-Cyclotella_meneghiniana.AAC.1